MLRAPDATIGPFREKDTMRLTATVQDNAGVAIPGTSLSAVTLTLYSEHGTNAIINGRDHTDITSEVNGSGVLTHVFTSADMAIVDAQPLEYHRALIEWTYNTTQRGSYEVRIVVRNVTNVS